MSRLPRLVMTVLIAMFIVAAPTAGAQSPVADQYEIPLDDARAAAPSDGEGAGPAAEAGVAPDARAAAPSEGEGAGPAAEGGVAPVQVREITPTQLDALPFTGGQISLLALIGLAVLAVGAVALAWSRRRASTNTT